MLWDIANCNEFRTEQNKIKIMQMRNNMHYERQLNAMWKNKNENEKAARREYTTISTEPN